MKKNYINLLAVFTLAVFLFAACNDEKKDEEKTDKESTVEQSDKTDKTTDDVETIMSIEEIAEKRAVLDCNAIKLTKQIQELEDGDEKTKLQEELSKVGDEINALNTEYNKYEGNQEEMEKHQAIYKEKINECN
jgi:hypothetical protein